MSRTNYAVIGDPIKHSLSPAMHNPTIQAMGLDGDYVAVHVKPDALAAFVERARNEFSGFNITVPHKNAIIPFLDSVSDECSLSKSVNTVSIRNGKLHGESTDGYGLETGISEAFSIDITGNCFCFIGCGGAAQAVAFYFAQKDAKELTFINRTLAKAEDLQQRIRQSFPHVSIRVCANQDEASIKNFIDTADVTIQATSLGLKPTDPPPVKPELFANATTAFYDTIYRETHLLKACQELGLRTADGRTMLLHQGVKSLAIWTGKPVPVEVMRTALYQAISQKSAQ